MAYHDDLLKQAIDLIHKDASNPTQADLRRAVSTAYYALFHLLISETTLNWNRASSRNMLGRMFDHSLMKKVADSRRMPFTGEDIGVVSGLRLLAKAFVDLQDLRHTADYDNGVPWMFGQA